MKKGLSIFMSHILAIAILFVILAVVSTQLFTYYMNIREETQKSQALSISQRVAEAVLGLYTNYRKSDYEPEEGGNRTLSEVYLNLPDKISGRDYTLSLEQHEKFWVEGSMENETSSKNERPYTSVKIEVGSSVYTYPIYNIVSVNVSGSVKMADRIKISYIRKRENGETKDLITMERIS